MYALEMTSNLASFSYSSCGIELAYHTLLDLILLDQEFAQCLRILLGCDIF